MPENPTHALCGKVILVTGATRGIGRAIAEHLAQAGARLVLTYRGNQAAAAETAARLAHLGAASWIVQADLADPTVTRALPQQVVERFGRLDGLVNNAGITVDGAYVLLEPQAYRPVMATNLLGTMRLSCSALPWLTASHGAIVMVSSLAGVNGKEGQVPYSTTKGGLNGFTRLLARQYDTTGVRVNAVAPGFIRTAMAQDLPESMYAHILKGTAQHRMGEAHEVAEVVGFLLSPAATYISGQTILVDGGFHR
jgi:3-oxoacyl-[acyl-carrier protein] reductase